MLASMTKLGGLLMFANQLVSFTDQEASDMDGILLFLFGRRNAEYEEEELRMQHHYMDELMLQMWQTEDFHWCKHVVAITMFNANDLQKQVIVEVDEVIVDVNGLNGEEYQYPPGA